MDRLKFDEQVHIRTTLNKWQRFLHNKTTEFWSEKEFIEILNNEQIIIEYEYLEFDGKSHAVKRNPNDEFYSMRIDFVKTKLDRLREIYNERFKEPEPEPKDHTKYTKHEIYYLLSKLGLTELQEYKHLSETNKAKLLSKILSCNTDTAKKIKNGTDHRYTVNEISKQKIDTFLDKLINEK